MTPATTDKTVAREKIHVTRSFLPPRAEFDRQVDRIWESNQLTNNGPVLQELESALKQHLDVPHLLFTGNGTIALQLALRALGISGEVITTPFSYVASTGSILWEQATPVFADIDPGTCCIDPARIEECITPRTQAILATHVYGVACDVEAIGEIARRHGLKVIYDGAHAFGSKYHGRALLDHGDVSTCSFHATKLFHSGEGGCVIARDPALQRRLVLMRQFGHAGDDHYMMGINGKNSEFHAAMGLSVLPHMPHILAERRSQWQWYAEAFRGLPGHRLLQLPEGLDYNHSYFPLFLPDEAQLLRTMEALQADDIFPRRYFHPSLDLLPYVTEARPCPVSREMASKVLCLPMATGLDPADQQRVIDIVRRVP